MVKNLKAWLTTELKNKQKILSNPCKTFSNKYCSQITVFVWDQAYTYKLEKNKNGKGNYV